MFTHYFKLVVLVYKVKQPLLTVFNFIDENDQRKVMSEHCDLLLYNSLQLLTVFNFIDGNDQLKVMCEHRKVKNSK
jgi:hypothetical protein